jgi:hypothetical protein
VLQEKYHARIARRPAPKPESVVSLPIASLLRFEEGPEISTHFLISFFGLKGREWDPYEKETVGSSERCSHGAAGAARDIGPLQPRSSVTGALTSLLRGQPEMVPKPSSPRLSTYRLVSSSSGHSIRAGISDTKFPHVTRSRRRRRPRSSSTSNGNDISLSSTHDSDEDPNLRLSEHQLDSSPEPLQPQPMLPLRVPLMRLSDPVPILQDSRVFHASSPSDDGPLLTYSSLPPTPIPSSPPPSTSNAERYRLPQKQSDVHMPPFSLWDYLREELLVTDFDSHQELKWDRVSNFLSIPIAIEKVSAFKTLRLKVSI